MVHKALLKKIIDMIKWIGLFAQIGICIFYFFISKNIFQGRLLPIWGVIGINNALSIVNSKYFEENLSWKNNWENITQVCMCSVFIVGEIIFNLRS